MIRASLLATAATATLNGRRVRKPSIPRLAPSADPRRSARSGAQSLPVRPRLIRTRARAPVDPLAPQVAVAAFADAETTLLASGAGAGQGPGPARPPDDAPSGTPAPRARSRRRRWRSPGRCRAPWSASGRSRRCASSRSAVGRDRRSCPRAPESGPPAAAAPPVPGVARGDLRPRRLRSSAPARRPDAAPRRSRARPGGHAAPNVQVLGSSPCAGRSAGRAPGAASGSPAGSRS